MSTHQLNAILRSGSAFAPPVILLNVREVPEDTDIFALLKSLLHYNISSLISSISSSAPRHAMLLQQGRRPGLVLTRLLFGPRASSFFSLF